MNNFDVDKVIGYVNKIIDNVRCATCDRVQGSLRYPCGHTACDDCITSAEECQTCTSSSQQSDSRPKPDYQLSLTVKNATDLLKASRNLFDVNAFQNKRISEQLRIEKELFPKCIQAPIKYENKRKSTNSSFINKENTYSKYFLGEAEAISIPDINKMERDSMSYVQQWLNKNEKNLGRKPFADLNVNTQQVISSKNKVIHHNLKDENVSLVANRKRSHYKTTDKDYSHLGGNRKSVNAYKSIPKKFKKEPCLSYLRNTSIDIQKCENDESGIFMDNDPIVINDSQESVIDKDKNAWLAVLKACENEDLTSNSLVIPSQVNTEEDSSKQIKNSDAMQIKDSHISRVPFIKRSAVTETCKYCKNEMSLATSAPVTNQTKPVKITIDNDNFLTTITVFQNVQNDIVMNTTSNVSVQTDTCKVNPVINDACVNNENIIGCSTNRRIIDEDLAKEESECSSDKQSIDLFADNRQIFADVYQKPEISKHIIIAESDSDTDLDISGPISVKADVHRSCQDIEYGILNEVVNVKEHETKPRRGPRGLTPTSTDSSEKENYNPNRIKKHTSGKKKSTKK